IAQYERARSLVACVPVSIRRCAAREYLCNAQLCCFPQSSRSIHHSNVPDGYKAGAPRIGPRFFEFREEARRGLVHVTNQPVDAVPLSSATSPFRNTLYPD